MHLAGAASPLGFRRQVGRALTPPLPSRSGDHKQKFYWGHKEILIPVFKNMADAMKKHPEVDVLINFASLRSAYDSTMETMNYAQVARCAPGLGGRGGGPAWCPGQRPGDLGLARGLGESGWRLDLQEAGQSPGVSGLLAWADSQSRVVHLHRVLSVLRLAWKTG